MFFGVIELMIVLLIGSAIVFGLFRGRGNRGEGGGFSWGHATLACPHCGQETRAILPCANTVVATSDAVSSLDCGIVA